MGRERKPGADKGVRIIPEKRQGATIQASTAGGAGIISCWQLGRGNDSGRFAGWLKPDVHDQHHYFALRL